MNVDKPDLLLAQSRHPQLVWVSDRGDYAMPQDSVSQHFPVWSLLYSLLFCIWGSLCLDLIEGGKTSWGQDKWTLKLSTTKITVTENQNGYQVKGPTRDRRAKTGGKLKWVTAKKHISILAKSGPNTRNYLI